jgi:putative transposase
MNAHIEAFHRLLEEECLERMMFDNCEEVYQSVMKYIYGFITNKGFV